MSAPGALFNWIGGSAVAARSGRTLPVYEPATGQAYTTLPDSGPMDVEAAVQAAERSSAGWARQAPEDRARLLERMADLIEARLEEFALAESRDTGKPLSLARRVDIPRAVSNFRFFASQLRALPGESVDGGPGRMHVVLRQPLGVVGCISPWNLPLYLLSWKLAPALAAGNTVVAKPSEITPYTATLLAALSADAGLPPGVLNLVHGLGSQVGTPLTTAPQVKAVSFTGSTATGRLIASATAPQFKKLSLEMGGKNPTIVFADCDFERTVAECVRAAFSNQGQICLCGSRILIEKPLFERFRAAFVERVQALKVGDPLEPGTDQGAVVSQAHFDKVMGCIALAREEGGRVLTGGDRVRLDGRCADGWFIAPTVFDYLPFDCRTNQDEIFGPVVTLSAFDDETQALLFANGTVYGLAASVWTRDLDRAQRFVAGLKAGLVWINCWMERDLRVPFGGVKQSGLGREGGLEAMRFFTEAKSASFVFSPESP